MADNNSILSPLNQLFKEIYGDHLSELLYDFQLPFVKKRTSKPKAFRKRRQKLRLP
jgi:23S rRNA U2552 (ribose-2'-O)-methylase RlmE/FtsJ